MRRKGVHDGPADEAPVERLAERLQRGHAEVCELARLYGTRVRVQCICTRTVHSTRELFDASHLWRATGSRRHEARRHEKVPAKKPSVRKSAPAATCVSSERLRAV